MMRPLVLLGACIISSLVIADDSPVHGEVQPVVKRNVPFSDQGAGGLPGAPKIEAPDDLQEIIDLDAGSYSTNVDAETIQRMSLVRTAGFEVGIAKGYANRINEELKRLRSAESLLNQIFSFRELFLIANHDIPVEQALHLRPPVISRLEDVIQIENDGRFLRTIDGVYRIIEEERFVVNPPRWQEYLLGAEVEYRETVHRVALPRNSAERATWREAVAAGWQQGQYQADAEIEARVHRLKRDFYGMLEFVELKLTRQIMDGYVAYQYDGVDGGSDEMSINSRTYQITNRSSLNPYAETWKGSLSKHVPPSYESAGVRVFSDVQNCSAGDAAECP